jgi:hypothetical protein
LDRGSPESFELPPFKPLSRVKQRLVRSAVEIEADDPRSILFQHTVFCQIALPYRNPGPTLREWERQQGRASCLIEASRARDPRTGQWIRLGLPFGPKPRLILAHLNAEALRTGSPEIEVDKSLTVFVKHIGLCHDGRGIRLVKDQLARLSAARIHLSVAYGETHARQINTHIVGGFDLWFPKGDRQRVLWPRVIELSLDYFASLESHAVPLDERAIAALSHSAMALDVYAWFAQRLHRIDPRRPQRISWVALRDQFGWHYGRMDNFKRVFRQTLDTVLSQYRGARLTVDGRGMTLRHSPPPVQGRLGVLSRH